MMPVSTSSGRDGASEGGGSMARRILFVDDDEPIRELVEGVLGRAGYEVTVAASAREGLEALRGGFRGLLLLDIVMPEMSGWEMVRVMRDEGLVGQAAICMVTGQQDPGQELDDLKDLVLDYVRKPFTVQELQDAVARNLAWIDA
jgi:CheY-like chemotaxis protein